MQDISQSIYVKSKAFHMMLERIYWIGVMFVDMQMEHQQYQLNSLGQQTYIQECKGSGGLKGISTNAEPVAVWINSFSICSHISIAFDDINSTVDEEIFTTDQDTEVQKATAVHKGEGGKRRQLDEDDHKKLLNELK